jgi:hypothetical protein
MKKTIVASIIGIAACAAVSTTYGQGNLIFANYSAAGGSAPATIGGLTCGPSFTAQLLYSSTGLAGSFAPVAGAASTFFGNSNGDTANGAGFFAPVAATVGSYTTGTAFFEAVVFNNGSLGAATQVGYSSVFSYSSLATASNLHLAQKPFTVDGSDCAVSLVPITVSAVPEPTTLALAGLGGLASLVALRRKQA